jgi:hypothetical protein
MAGKNLSPKYTPKDLLGDSVAEHLKGTRLAAHLLQIRDRFGAGDPLLKRLATKALAGHIHADQKEQSDIFNAIGDRLAQHEESNYYARHDPYMKPEHRGSSKGDEGYKTAARDLAEGINWHRVGHAVQLDKLLSDHIQSLVPQEHQAKGQTFKVAQHWLKDNRFKNELLNLVKNQTGTKSGIGLPSEYANEDKIRDSIERLNRREEYRRDLDERGRKQVKETRQSVLQQKKPTIQPQVSAVDTLNWLPGSGPAWSHKFTPKGVKKSVSKDLDAEQYKTKKDKVMYALLGRLFKKSTPEPIPEVPHQPVEGVSAHGYNSQDPNVLKTARGERQAVMSFLNENKIPHTEFNNYMQKIREQYHSPYEVVDESYPRLKFYKDYIKSTQGANREPEHIKQALEPLLEHHAISTFGHLPPPLPTEHFPIEQRRLDAEAALPPAKKKGKERPPLTKLNSSDNTVHEDSPFQLELPQQKQESHVSLPLPPVDQEGHNRKNLLTSLNKALKRIQTKGVAPEEDAATKAAQAKKKKPLRKIKLREGKPLPKKTTKREDDEPLKLFRRNVERAIKYGHEEVKAILPTMEYKDWVGGPDADHIKRGVLADAYEEATGHTEGANALRTPGYPVIPHNGQILPAYHAHVLVNHSAWSPHLANAVAAQDPETIVDILKHKGINKDRIRAVRANTGEPLERLTGSYNSVKDPNYHLSITPEGYALHKRILAPSNSNANWYNIDTNKFGTKLSELQKESE